MWQVEIISHDGKRYLYICCEKPRSVTTKKIKIGNGSRIKIGRIVHDETFGWGHK